MDNYRTILLLLYFKDVGSEYDFSEAKELLGLNHNQFEDLLETLLEKKFLQYEDHVLKITYKGIRFLIKENSIGFSSGKTEFENNDNLKMSIEEPYVPEKFTKKFSLR